MLASRCRPTEELLAVKGGRSGAVEAVRSAIFVFAVVLGNLCGVENTSGVPGVGGGIGGRGGGCFDSFAASSGETSMPLRKSSLRIETTSRAVLTVSASSTCLLPLDIALASIQVRGFQRRIRERPVRPFPRLRLRQ